VIDQVARQHDQISIKAIGFMHDAVERFVAGERADVRVADVGDAHAVERPRQVLDGYFDIAHAEGALLRDAVCRRAERGDHRKDHQRRPDHLPAGERFIILRLITSASDFFLPTSDL
jgi:hypothetical protein